MTGCLDFSVFHPLGHPIWECFDWYGGPWVHLQYWYQHKFEYHHTVVWHRLTGCLWGKHQMSPVWRRDEERKWQIAEHICIFCQKPKIA